MTPMTPASGRDDRGRIDSAPPAIYVLPVFAVAQTVALAFAALVAASIALFNLLTFAVAFARPPRPRRLLVAVLKELLANLVLIPVWPLFLFIGARYQRRHTDPTGRRRGRPVILLHGYLMNRTNWVWLGRALSRRGLGPLYGLSYLSTAGSERAARRLARFVEEVCAREGADTVDIVAHSLGGLVARRYIEHMDGGPRVRRLITIGTPHRGTGWARVIFGKAGRDLAPPLSTVGGHGQAPIGSSNMGAPEGVLYTSIWSRCDNLVVPPESAQLTPRLPPDGAATATAIDASGDRLDDVVFDDLGHLSLLVSPRVADAVATRLAA